VIFLQVSITFLVSFSFAVEEMFIPELWDQQLTLPVYSWYGRDPLKVLAGDLHLFTDKLAEMRPV